MPSAIPSSELTLDYIRQRSDEDPHTGCWNWNRCITSSGYGLIGVRRFPSKLAHRAAYQIATGEPAPALMDVCHRCDNRRCVNPEHLFVGSRSDNMRDCVAKGRLRSPLKAGLIPSSRKLTEDQVREIRADTQRSNRVLARAYGVSRRAIQFVKQRRNWSST